MKRRAALIIAGALFYGVPASALDPTVSTTDTNATLHLIPSTAYKAITRLGVFAKYDAPDLLFKPSNSACSLNAGAGDGGSQVQSADGKCWLAVFPSFGGSSYRTAAWWGAPQTSAAGGDPVPLLQAMLDSATSSTYFDFSGASYTLKSRSLPIYPANQGGGLRVRSKSKSVFDRRGASFALDNTMSATQTAHFVWENNTDIQILGGNMVGNRTGLTGSQENGADVFFSNNRLRLEGGVTYTGDWTVLGAPIAGNFNTSSVFDVQELYQVGFGFDIGQCNACDIIIRKISGSGPGQVGFSNIWDPNFAKTTTLTAAPTGGATSLTVASITNFANGDKVAVGRPETGYQYVTVNGTPSGASIPITALPAAAVNGANVVNLKYNQTGVNFVEGEGNKLTILQMDGNFNTGVRLTTGKWTVDGDISNNASSGVAGFGLIVDYVNGTSFSSVGHATSSTILRGRYANNGNVAHNGGGIYVNSNAVGQAAITGAVTNGAGGTRLTVASTAALVTGQLVYVTSIGGVPEATSAWNITVFDATHFDIPVAFTGLFASNGVYTIDAIGPVLFDGVLLENNNNFGAAVSAYAGIRSKRVLSYQCPPSTIQTTCLGTFLVPDRLANGPSNPAGTAAAAMMGDTTTFVPNSTGNIFVWSKGGVANTATPNTSLVELRYGTGTPPSNGDALTGTVVDFQLITAATNNGVLSFSLNGYLPNLVNGTTYWIGHGLTPSAGTSTITKVYFIGRED